MEIIKLLQSFSNPFWDKFFIGVTILGEEYIYIILLSLIFWCVDKKYGYKLAFGFLFSCVLNGVVKNIFKAARPLDIKELRHLRVETATGHSFPSGHTQNITSFTTSIMKRYRTILLYIVGPILILLVGISRLYLGVHWPLDVLGGMAFGVICIFTADFVFDYSERKKNKYILLALIPPAAVVTLLFSDSADLVKSAAVFCSFLTGYLIEDRYIKFDTKTGKKGQVIKLALGLSVVFALKEILKIVLPETALWEFLRYFAIGMWITVVAPCAFRYLRLVDTGSTRERDSIGA